MTDTSTANEYDIERLRSEALEFTGVGLCRYKFDGTILYIDINTLKILELDVEFSDPQMLAGKNIEDFIVYIKPKMTIRNMVREQGFIKNLEYTFKTLKGKQKWIMHDSYKVYDEHAGEDVVQVIMRDISKLKLVEAELKDSEECFKMLFEFAPEALFILNSNGKFLNSNKAVEDLTGYSKKELLGKSILLLNLIEPLDLPRIATALNASANGQPTGPDEFVFVNKGCARVDVELRTIPFALKGEKLVLALARDITRRKMSEEALKESEKQLRRKLDYILTQEQETGDFTLLELMDLDDLQRIQDSFAKVTGTASIITDTESRLITRPSNFTRICTMIQKTKQGNERCALSDKLRVEHARIQKEPIYRQCLSCGFMDASAPIVVAGRHIGNWLIGQVNVGYVDRGRIEEFAKYIGADVDEMLRAFDEVPCMSEEQFKSVLDLLRVLTQEISKLAYDNLRLAKDITRLKRTNGILQVNDLQ